MLLAFIVEPMSISICRKIRICILFITDILGATLSSISGLRRPNRGRAFVGDFLLVCFRCTFLISAEIVAFHSLSLCIHSPHFGAGQIVTELRSVATHQSCHYKRLRLFCHACANFRSFS